MKPIFAVIVLIAAVAADVSHLNSMYLPPKGGLNAAASEQHQQQSEYVEQGNEIPQVIGANTFTPAHLLEPSNSLAVEESRPQPLFPGSSIYPRLQDEDIRIDQGGSSGAPAAEPEESQNQEVAVEQRFADLLQHVEQQEEVAAEQPAVEESHFVEQQPAAQEFVPQTYGDIVYGDIPVIELGQQSEERYETAPSSPGIDTQYGSNGGYVY